MVSTLLEPATYLMAREIQTDKEAAINILFAAAEFKWLIFYIVRAERCVLTYDFFSGYLNWVLMLQP